MGGPSSDPKIRRQGQESQKESMGVQGAYLWKSLPMEIRNYGGPDCSLQDFKLVLDDYLKTYPGIWP